MSQIFSLPGERTSSTDFNALSFRHKRAEQRALGRTGIQTKAPYDKTNLVYLVADMVMLYGRYGIYTTSLIYARKGMQPNSAMTPALYLPVFDVHMQFCWVVLIMKAVLQ